MSAQDSLPSDSMLAQVKSTATAAIEGNWVDIVVNARAVLALVACAEVLKEIRADMESGWLANHGKAAERNYEELLKGANAAIAKLESL